MAKAGDVFENPVTGERAVVRLGSEDTNEDRAVVDLDVVAGGAAGEHVHPVMEESFTVEWGRWASASMGASLLRNKPTSARAARGSARLVECRR